MSLNIEVPIGGGGGAGTVADITSTGGTITITAPTGPTTNVEVTTTNMVIAAVIKVSSTTTIYLNGKNTSGSPYVYPAMFAIQIA
jgi:hypothetical protein